METSSRSLLDKELAELRNNILRLTSMVDQAIEGGMAALIQRDLDQAYEILAQDERINQLRYEIEQGCLTTLATQQPFAADLRMVITAMHLASELERIGDHAAGIARLVERLKNEPEIESFHKLPKMAKRARKMIQESIQAFVEHDAVMAQRMMSRDDKVDRHYRDLFRETLEEMRDDDYIRRATFLLWVGHNLERIGDRAINVAERVIFMVTGRFVENQDLID